MKTPVIGTLIRCADINERRIAFYREIGLDVLQIAGVYEPCLAPGAGAEKASDGLFELFRENGLGVPGMFLSFPNQDWAHPKEGIGLVPEKTRAERMILSCRQMNWAKRYGISQITCHVGFLPETGDAVLTAALKQLARFAASNGQEFLFETGPDTIAILKQTIERIGEPNVGINFDPANLLIYNNDDPAALLDTMPGLVRSVHCKDAVRPAAGQTLGKETVLGQGDTKFAALAKRLVATGFSGPIIIERELPLGPEQEKDVTEAVKYIKSILKEK